MGDIWRPYEQFKSYEDKDGSNISAATPKFMIECPEFFSSEYIGNEGKASPCIAVNLGMYRNSQGYTAAGELDGKELQMSPVTVLMRIGSWTPLIVQYNGNNTNIESIIIRRISSTNADQDIFKQTFNRCYILSNETDDINHKFTFCYQSIEMTHTYYDFAGDKKGQTATLVNMVTGEHKAP